MTTYKQEIKDKSRIELWGRAFNYLTKERRTSQVIQPSYIRRLWDYSFYEILSKNKITPDEGILNYWNDFSESIYRKKSADELKIAYFCGPEPDNDLQILLSLGARTENIWAIESDKKYYLQAVNNIKNKHPTLKIFNGKISDLMKSNPTKFDIIYLDFTASLISQQSGALATIHSIFDYQALSDLGILIVNSTVPDETTDNIEFLSRYFHNHPFLESAIIEGEKSNLYYTEGAAAHGYGYFKKFSCKVKRNFTATYSAFCTHYPAIFSSYIQPMYRVANSPPLKKMFFNIDDKESNIINSISRISQTHDGTLTYTDNSDEGSLYGGSEIYENPEEFPIWNFIESIKKSKSVLCQYWHQQFTKKQSGLSIFQAIQLYDLLRSAHYKDYTKSLSFNLKNAIEEIQKALPDPHGGVFCDVPMPHLWAELALNHLGNAYHINTTSHWRAAYKAKTREMYLDLFVFDKCKSLYDWLPMLDLYGDNIVTLERQIIIRACMDAITKQNHYSSHFSYYGANLIGKQTKPWSKIPKMPKRIIIE